MGIWRTTRTKVIFFPIQEVVLLACSSILSPSAVRTCDLCLCVKLALIARAECPKNPQTTNPNQKPTQEIVTSTSCRGLGQEDFKWTIYRCCFHLTKLIWINFSCASCVSYVLLVVFQPSFFMSHHLWCLMALSGHLFICREKARQ